MAGKRDYIKPRITRVDLDSSFTLMQASPPVNPMMMPSSGGSKGSDTPFESPFSDKPFS